MESLEGPILQPFSQVMSLYCHILGKGWDSNVEMRFLASFFLDSKIIGSLVLALKLFVIEVIFNNLVYRSKSF